MWANADGLSANSLNDCATRTRLRNRSRYEEQNNGYYGGLVTDRANETVGTGPRLQLSFTGQPAEANSDAAHQVELRWEEWCQSVGLLDKLLLMDEGETREGEVFGLKFTNPRLPDSAPQLDLRLYEADQCTTPDLDLGDTQAVDGIRFDGWGNPVEYHLLRQHPGELRGDYTLAYDRYPWHRVLHWFKPKRAGQARGVPVAQSSLPLCGILRQYTLATLGSAELQARITGTIENPNALPNGEDEEGGEEQAPFQEVPIGSNLFVTLPNGMTAKGFDATQPTSQYKDFKAEIVTESGRPMNAPRNVSNGSSAEYNYSSGRLDQQQWQRAIRIRRRRFERVVLDDLFRSWYREALLIPGYLPSGLPPVAAWRYRWRWDGFVSIDPVKDATANEIALRSGQTTLDRVCGEQGEDWEEAVHQQARELALRKRLGLPVPGESQPPPQSPQPKRQADPLDEEGDDESFASAGSGRRYR